MKDLQEKIKEILDEWKVIGTKPGTNFALDVDDLAKEIAQSFIESYHLLDKRSGWFIREFKLGTSFEDMKKEILNEADIITIKEKE